MIIKEVYKRFFVPTGIQWHMIMVASVANMIADNWIGPPLDKELLITGALLHDMGNIAKMDFTGPHAYFYSHNISYWRKKKNLLCQKYGNTVDEVTMGILKDLNVNKRIIDVIQNIGIVAYLENKQLFSLESLILCYADMRVAPSGIVSLQERLQDGRNRYSKYDWAKEDEFENIVNNATGDEKKIFPHCLITPNDINDKNAIKSQLSLWNYKIHAGM